MYSFCIPSQMFSIGGVNVVITDIVVVGGAVEVVVVGSVVVGITTTHSLKNGSKISFSKHWNNAKKLPRMQPTKRVIESGWGLAPKKTS